MYHCKNKYNCITSPYTDILTQILDPLNVGNVMNGMNVPLYHCKNKHNFITSPYFDILAQILDPWNVANIMSAMNVLL